MKKASYAVLFYLRREQTAVVGSLGNVFFWRGYYIYVGSYPYARVDKRIQRHRRKDKKRFWHIDYFSSLPGADFLGYYVSLQPECSLAQSFARRYAYIDKFGSSDCRCPSHLFFSSRRVPGKAGKEFLQKKVDRRRS